MLNNRQQTTSGGCEHSVTLALFRSNLFTQLLLSNFTSSKPSRLLWKSDGAPEVGRPIRLLPEAREPLARTGKLRRPKNEKVKHLGERKVHL